mgnify:CR=1 FL=1
MTMSDSKRSDEANEGLLAFITEPVSDHISIPAKETSHSLSISMPGTRVWRPPAYPCCLRQKFS